MFCKNCGKEINENAVVCVNCGCSVEKEKTTKKKKKKKKTLIVCICVALLLIFFIAVGSSETPSDETDESKKTSAVTTTVPTEFSGECPVEVSATVDENVIGVPELTCHIKNNTDKDIEAIQFYFVPKDVYGEEINTVVTTNRIQTDERIGAGSSAKRAWQLLDTNIKSGTLYVYSVYFSDGTEWGDKESSTTNIIKYCEKISVVE